MNLHELLNKALELIETNPEDKEKISKYWFSDENMPFVSKEKIAEFNQILEAIYGFKEKVYSRFTRQKVYKAIEISLVNKKKKEELFTINDEQGFFSEFENREPYNRYMIAPISGIRLDSNDKIKISIFEIGRTNQLKSILSNDNDGYYISVKIENFYDELIAIEEAKNKFSDFIRLIIFISGKNDKKILIKTGLPSYPSMTHEQMYVETNSYQILETMEDTFPSSTINNTYLEKVPVDNEFFYKNEDFKKIWEIYENKHSNKKISSMESRLLNASIAIGESALSRNTKNSIIYTSMALEILFSYDEGSLFQKSIGDKLSDTFAFIVGTDKDSRLKASKAVKEFYRLRSALVHGGDTKTNNDYIVFNIFLRSIINELLNNKKYENIKKIEDLYNMVKEAQYSY